MHHIDSLLRESWYRCAIQRRRGQISTWVLHWRGGQWSCSPCHLVRLSHKVAHAILSYRADQCHLAVLLDLLSALLHSSWQCTEAKSSHYRPWRLPWGSSLVLYLFHDAAEDRWQVSIYTRSDACGNNRRSNSSLDLLELLIHQN